MPRSSPAWHTCGPRTSEGRPTNPGARKYVVRKCKWVVSLAARHAFAALRLPSDHGNSRKAAKTWHAAHWKTAICHREFGYNSNLETGQTYAPGFPVNVEVETVPLLGRRAAFGILRSGEGSKRQTPVASPWVVDFVKAPTPTVLIGVTTTVHKKIKDRPAFVDSVSLGHKLASNLP